MKRPRRITVTCPYCGEDAVLTTGAEIYPHSPRLESRRFWICRPCEAYVGTHRNSGDNKPLGPLAKEGLRASRRAVHLAFDPIWTEGHLSRQSAYNTLGSLLGMKKGTCHISHMDDETCQRAMKAVEIIRRQIKNEKK